MKLDSDDRAALARLATYVLLFLLALAGLLLLGAVAGEAVHLYRWAGG